MVNFTRLFQISFIIISVFCNSCFINVQGKPIFIHSLAKASAGSSRNHRVLSQTATSSNSGGQGLITSKIQNVGRALIQIGQAFERLGNGPNSGSLPQNVIKKDRSRIGMNTRINLDDTINNDSKKSNDKINGADNDGDDEDGASNIHLSSKSVTTESISDFMFRDDDKKDEDNDNDDDDKISATDDDVDEEKSDDGDNDDSDKNSDDNVDDDNDDDKSRKNDDKDEDEDTNQSLKIDLFKLGDDGYQLDGPVTDRSTTESSGIDFSTSDKTDDDDESNSFHITASTSTYDAELSETTENLRLKGSSNSQITKSKNRADSGYKYESSISTTQKYNYDRPSATRNPVKNAKSKTTRKINGRQKTSTAPRIDVNVSTTPRNNVKTTPWLYKYENPIKNITASRMDIISANIQPENKGSSSSVSSGYKYNDASLTAAKSISTPVLSSGYNYSNNKSSTNNYNYQAPQSSNSGFQIIPSNGYSYKQTGTSLINQNTAINYNQPRSNNVLFANQKPQGYTQGFINRDQQFSNNAPVNGYNYQAAAVNSNFNNFNPAPNFKPIPNFNINSNSIPVGRPNRVSSNANPETSSSSFLFANRLPPGFGDNPRVVQNQNPRVSATTNSAQINSNQQQNSGNIRYPLTTQIPFNANPAAFANRSPPGFGNNPRTVQNQNLAFSDTTKSSAQTIPNQQQNTANIRNPVANSRPWIVQNQNPTKLPQTFSTNQQSNSANSNTRNVFTTQKPYISNPGSSSSTYLFSNRLPPNFGNNPIIVENNQKFMTPPVTINSAQTTTNQQYSNKPKQVQNQEGLLQFRNPNLKDDHNNAFNHYNFVRFNDNLSKPIQNQQQNFNFNNNQILKTSSTIQQSQQFSSPTTFNTNANSRSNILQQAPILVQGQLQKHSTGFSFTPNFNQNPGFTQSASQYSNSNNNNNSFGRQVIPTFFNAPTTSTSNSNLKPSLNQQQGYQYQGNNQQQGYQYQGNNQQHGNQYQGNNQQQGYQYQGNNQQQGNQKQGYQYQGNNQQKGYQYQGNNQQQVYQYQGNNQQQGYQNQQHQGNNQLQNNQNQDNKKTSTPIGSTTTTGSILQNGSQNYKSSTTPTQFNNNNNSNLKIIIGNRPGYQYQGNNNNNQNNLQNILPAIVAASVSQNNFKNLKTTNAATSKPKTITDSSVSISSVNTLSALKNLTESEYYENGVRKLQFPKSNDDKDIAFRTTDNENSLEVGDIRRYKKQNFTNRFI